MDARLDPLKFTGLAEGDAHIIRNAGGRASDDAIRSLVVSVKLTGTSEWIVIHHTDCAMETISNETMGDLLAESASPSLREEGEWVNPDSYGGSDEGKKIDWLALKENNLSLIEDCARIRNHPLVPDSCSIYGCLYDCASGRLIEIPEATEAGRVGKVLLRDRRA